jgi:osmotically-inducible protein OsmY
MAPSADLLALPTDQQADQGKDALPQTAALPTQTLTETLEDLDLTGRVERALHATGYGALRHIEVTVQARIVTLAGRVSGYYLKQVAQTAALKVPGIRQIRNDVAVVSRSGLDTPS